MPTSRLALSADLPSWAVATAIVLALVSLALLTRELKDRPRAGILFASGALALIALLGAVLRPQRVSASETMVGARVLLLLDGSRSMLLPAASTGNRTRASERAEIATNLLKANPGARWSTMEFGAGTPKPIDPGSLDAHDAQSDLQRALEAVRDSEGEHPSAIVVVSDGSFGEPAADHVSDAARGLSPNVPVHTIAVSKDAPPDASVRKISWAGAAVAHVPVPLQIEVGCTRALACESLEVVVRELRDEGSPEVLAKGTAAIHDGSGTIQLPVTIQRAGTRILEVAIAPTSGDTIPGNDRRLFPVHVSRERVRILHVAGRTTNDVRSLRLWLKRNRSIDLVTFFILRTKTDDSSVLESELALIKFPVDELFSDHLPSFDAVILQDFDAQPYGLEKHLPSLQAYVKTGGGLIMVGGPNSFVSGGYARTPLARVLPVELDGTSEAAANDPDPLTPQFTEAGRELPLLSGLRSVLGDSLPSMTGANIVGDARPEATVLWTHPTRKTKSGKPMPLFTVADEGDGRSVALGLDGTWQLEFSDMGARTGGRAYPALWEGIIGWLMRDPRFEPTAAELASPCVAGEPNALKIHGLGGVHGPVKVVVRRLGEKGPGTSVSGELKAGSDVVELAIPAQSEGGYTARVQIDRSPPTRLDFACEAGGAEWADAEPDVSRLEAIAKGTGGTFSTGAKGTLPLPNPTVVTVSKQVTPLLPAWVWTLVAAILLGGHWIVRRSQGLT